MVISQNRHSVNYQCVTGGYNSSLFVCLFSFLFYVQRRCYKSQFSVIFFSSIYTLPIRDDRGSCDFHRRPHIVYGHDRLDVNFRFRHGSFEPSKTVNRPKCCIFDNIFYQSSSTISFRVLFNDSAFVVRNPTRKRSTRARSFAPSCGLVSYNTTCNSFEVFEPSHGPSSKCLS